MRTASLRPSKKRSRGSDHALQSEYWIVAIAACVAAAGFVSYAIRHYEKELDSSTRSILSPPLLPRVQKAWIQIDFGNERTRRFEGIVNDSRYSLHTSLAAVAKQGKFTFTVQKGRIIRIAGVGNRTGIWKIYHNGIRVYEPLEKLIFSSGDHYLFQYQP